MNSDAHVPRLTIVAPETGLSANAFITPVIFQGLVCLGTEKASQGKRQNERLPSTSMDRMR